MKNLTEILVLWISLVVTGIAQTQESRIVDLDGNGVAGVEIEMVGRCFQSIGPERTETKSTASDSAGRFTWPLTELSAGSNCVVTRSQSYTLKKAGYDFTRNTFLFQNGGSIITPNYDDRLPVIQATALPLWANVSAAHFDNVGATQRKVIAAGMLMAGFGVQLANVIASAPTPLPTEFASRKVLVKDAAGVERAAQILFVSPGQINYVLPEGLANGAAQIRLVDQNNNLIRIGLAEVRQQSPGIFTANFDGSGVPAGLVVRVKPGNVQTYEPIARLDPVSRKSVPIELDLGPPDEFLVLALFGTGWRLAPSVGVEVYRPSSNGTDFFSVGCPLEYIGPQPTFAGLDQINVRLPRELIGEGELTLRLVFGGSYNNGNQVKLFFK